MPLPKWQGQTLFFQPRQSGDGPVLVGFPEGEGVFDVVRAALLGHLQLRQVEVAGAPQRVVQLPARTGGHDHLQTVELLDRLRSGEDALSRADPAQGPQTQIVVLTDAVDLIQRLQDHIDAELLRVFLPAEHPKFHFIHG